VGTWDKSERRSFAGWVADFPGLVIRDPGGMRIDGMNLGVSLTRAGFLRRVARCTVEAPTETLAALAVAVREEWGRRPPGLLVGVAWLPGARGVNEVD
jgi:hypothetical protein